jgi:hypothetical protein
MICSLKATPRRPRSDRRLFALLSDQIEQHPFFPVQPIRASRELFFSTVNSTFSSLHHGDASSFYDCLRGLCGLFASPHSLYAQFCDSLLEHPLLPSLIAAFDEPRMLPFSELIA